MLSFFSKYINKCLLLLIFSFQIWYFLDNDWKKFTYSRIKFVIFPPFLINSPWIQLPFLKYYCYVTFLYSTLIFVFRYSSPLVAIHVNKLEQKINFCWIFNFCLSGYFKCSMITWDSTNMQKGISSSPKVFYSPSTSFTNTSSALIALPPIPKQHLNSFS